MSTTTTTSLYTFILVIIIANVLDISQVVSSQSIPLPSGANQLIVDRHNQLRARLGIRTKLSWSPTIALFAQGRAMFQRCNGLSHAGLRQYGENLAMGSGDNTVKTIDRLLTLWINEGVGGGHYDQMVWNDSTEIGCAVSSCQSDLYLVCNYNPPGNVKGQSIFSGGYHPSLPSSSAINRVIAQQVMPQPQPIIKPSPSPSPKKNMAVLAVSSSPTPASTPTSTTAFSTPTMIPTFSLLPLLPLYADVFTSTDSCYTASPTPPPSFSPSSNSNLENQPNSNTQPLQFNSAINLSLSSSSFTTLLVSVAMAITTFLII